MMNELKGKYFKRFIQTVSYLPHFISWVIIYGIFYALFNVTNGSVNQLLTGMGYEKISLLTDKGLFWQTLLVSNVWKNVGCGSIVYLAAISSINSEMYESANMDGASRWQQMYYITIPAIMPTFCIMYILAVGRILNEDFEQVLMFMGGPENVYMTNVGEVFETYVYRVGMLQARYDFSTAVSVLKSVFGLIIMLP